MFLSEIFNFKISPHKIKDSIVEVRFFPRDVDFDGTAYSDEKAFQ